MTGPKNCDTDDEYDVEKSEDYNQDEAREVGKTFI